MKNVTITLDEEAARWARVRAAEKNKSLSRFIGEIVHDHMRHSLGYVEAMNGWRSEQPIRLKQDPGDRYLTREEAHDRDRLRRR
jgi:hypothetical protein